ncbi:MAG: hypothetical protein K6D96_00575 [Acetatifactor sp.]|nr:hypothetical protein [Acetatifactor sp.]
MNEFKSSRICSIKELFTNIINGITLFFAFYAASSILGNVTHAKNLPGAGWWIIFVAVMFLQYILRINIKKTFVFLILNMIMPVMIFLLPSGILGTRILFTIIAFFYSIYSVFLFTTTTDKLSVSFSPVFTGGLGIVSLFILHRFDYREYDLLMVILFLISLCLYFLKMYLDRFVNFVNVNLASAAHIPVKSIFRSNSVLLCFYVILGGVLIFILSSFKLISDLFKNIAEFMRKSIIFLLSLLPEPEVVQTEAEEVTRNELPTNYGDLFVAGEASPVWKYVDLLTTFLVVVLILALSVFVFKKIYEFIVARYKKQKPLTVIENSDYEEVHEAIESDIKPQEKHSFNLFMNLSPRMQIRNIYKKRIRQSKLLLTKSGDDNSLLYLTSRECEKILEKKGMSDIYEKARYSDKPVISEDVALMRNICR